MSDDGRPPEWDPPPAWDPPPPSGVPSPRPPGDPDREPPRKRPRVRLLMIGGGASVAVLLVAAILVGTVHSRADILASWTPPGWSPSSSASSSPSSSPTSSPLRGNPRASASSTASGAADYGTPEHNRIYLTATMRGVHCHADLRSTATAAYKKYARQVTACLNRAWQPVLGSQGIAFHPPGVVVASHPGSPCANDETGYHPFAYYCETDETMYFSTRAIGREHYTMRDRDYLMESVVHEYGHHVQTLFGLWPYYSRRRDAAQSDVARYTRLSRRTELQPQCFAGMFMGRNASTMHISERAAKDMAAHSGDDSIAGVKTHPEYRTHGHDRNSGYYFTRGWDTGRAASCDTWTAPAARVS